MKENIFSALINVFSLIYFVIFMLILGKITFTFSSLANYYLHRRVLRGRRMKKIKSHLGLIQNVFRLI